MQRFSCFCLSPGYGSVDGGSLCVSVSLQGTAVLMGVVYVFLSLSRVRQC